MAFTDNVATLKAEVISTVKSYTDAATTTLAALQADDAALADLQATILTQRMAIEAQIKAYQSITPAPATVA